MRLSETLLPLSNSDAEWVFGGATNTSTTSTTTTSGGSIREGGRTVGAGNVGEILA